jgi:hypothetical protein
LCHFCAALASPVLCGVLVAQAWSLSPAMHTAGTAPTHLAPGEIACCPGTQEVDCAWGLPFLKPQRCCLGGNFVTAHPPEHPGSFSSSADSSRGFETQECWSVQLLKVLERGAMQSTHLPAPSTPRSCALPSVSWTPGLLLLCVYFTDSFKCCGHFFGQVTEGQMLSDVNWAKWEEPEGHGGSRVASMSQPVLLFLLWEPCPRPKHLWLFPGVCHSLGGPVMEG